MRELLNEKVSAADADAVRNAIIDRADDLLNDLDVYPVDGSMADVKQSLLRAIQNVRQSLSIDS